jgi:hypothetical protein
MHGVLKTISILFVMLPVIFDISFLSTEQGGTYGLYMTIRGYLEGRMLFLCRYNPVKTNSFLLPCHVEPLWSQLTALTVRGMAYADTLLYSRMEEIDVEIWISSFILHGLDALCDLLPHFSVEILVKYNLII